MTDEEINKKANRYYPVSLSTYNEEAVDVNEPARTAYIRKQKIIQKALKDEKKEKKRSEDIMGTLIIVRNVCLYILGGIVIQQVNLHVSKDVISNDVIYWTRGLWTLFTFCKMWVDIKHETK